MQQRWYGQNFCMQKVSFAQWHYHSLWSSTETWWLLIENFSQYPARRREIPAAMQCLEDSSGSISIKWSLKLDPQWCRCFLCVVMFLSFLILLFVALLKLWVILSCKQPQVNVVPAATTLEMSFASFKTVLTRIISIVRVPSLCFNKDTHNNFDDEL